MAHHIQLQSDCDLEEWRAAARLALARGFAPQDVVWSSAPSGEIKDLFASPDAVEPAITPTVSARVPRAFLDLAGLVICHSARERFALLYRLLWRLQRERRLLTDPADPDVRRASELAKAVRRDKHKMTAFVRFREVQDDGRSVWIAWFEPQHHIVEAAAPFFVRRFASMKWSILTPGTSAHWNERELTFTTGATRADAPSDDALEDYWRIYFSSIFNPARLNISAMQREMPKRYWKNMPETRLIPDLIRSAPGRTTEMLKNLPAARRGHLPEQTVDGE